MLKRWCISLVALTFVLVAKPAFAIITVESYQVGGFYADGTKDNFAGFQNYFVGYGTTPGFPRTPERRNFFVFDLSAVTDPVTSATFTFTLPFGGLIGDEPSEIFVLSGTPIPASFVLSPGLTPPESLSVFTTLGTGPLFAPELGFDVGAPPVGLLVMTLNATGLGALNASLGGFFTLTGKMASWSFDPSPVAEPHELIFGHSDVIFFDEPVVAKPFLSLTTAAIPEPAAVSFVLLAACALNVMRRRG